MDCCGGEGYVGRVTFINELTLLLTHMVEEKKLPTVDDSEVVDFFLRRREELSDIKSVEGDAHALIKKMETLPAFAQFVYDLTLFSIVGQEHLRRVTLIEVAGHIGRSENSVRLYVRLCHRLCSMKDGVILVRHISSWPVPHHAITLDALRLVDERRMKEEDVKKSVKVVEQEGGEELSVIKRKVEKRKHHKIRRGA